MYYILAAAGGRMPVDHTPDSLRFFTDCLDNITEKGVIAITGIWEVEATDSPAVTEAYTMEKNA